MTGTLAGRRALVTGAASGIGRATLLLLREAGADGVGLDLRPGDPEDARFVLADIADERQVIDSVAAAARRLGAIDILVNSAGRQIDAPIRTQNVDDFDRLFAINVRGTATVTREVLRVMPAGGRIINLASELAYLGRAGASAYCATKGAILALTRSWARELAPDILVNAVAPGPIDTPLLGFEGMDEGQKALELDNPLRRIGRPEEVAAAILFLAGPGASFMTGQCIGVDGGAAMR